MHQDKLTSPETQQLGPRGEAADLGEISGLSSFSFFGFFVFLVFSPLCPARLRMDYTLPGGAESQGSQAIVQPAW